MKDVHRLIENSSTLLRSPEAISLSAHCLHIYIQEKFINELAVSLKVIREEIEVDLKQAEPQSKKDLLSFVPNTLPRVVDVCSQLSTKGHIMFLQNKLFPENSYVVCDQQTLLSVITGTVYAPENFRQHCTLGSSTGVVPLFKLHIQFRQLDLDMLLAFMSHLEFCFEIKDEQVLKCISTDHLESPESASAPHLNNRYLFFPGLITIAFPVRVWESQVGFRFHFGWILHCSQPVQFFDARCLHVLILRLMFVFKLAPAKEIQYDTPSLQRFCSVWKNGMCWCNVDGIVSLVELVEQSKALVVQIRCQELTPKCLEFRGHILHKVLETAQQICPNLDTIESVILPTEVETHPLNTISQLSLFEIHNMALAVHTKSPVKSIHESASLSTLLQFEPFACLDRKSLSFLYHPLNPSLEEKVSDSFIIHFIKQFRDSGDKGMLKKIISKVDDDSSSHGLSHALKSWRSETEGTYQCLRDTLDKYSIFGGRNPLDLAGVPPGDWDPSLLAVTARPGQTARPGEKITLTVVDELLQPPFSCRWTLEETLISADDPDYEGSLTHSLIIKECLSKHKGLYDCVVTSGANGNEAVYQITNLEIDGTVIHPHEARLLGRFLQTMEDFKSGKAGIDTGKLVNYGISDQPLEELQILLRRIPATCNLADNLFEYLASKVEEERHYHEAMKNDLKLRLTYLKMIGLGPPLIGKTTFFARLEEDMKWDLVTASKATQPSCSTKQVESRTIGVIETVNASCEDSNPIQSALVPDSSTYSKNEKVAVALPDVRSQIECSVFDLRRTQMSKTTSDNNGEEKYVESEDTIVTVVAPEYTSHNVSVSSSKWYPFEGEAGLKSECAHIYKYIASNRDSPTGIVPNEDLPTVREASDGASNPNTPRSKPINSQDEQSETVSTPAEVSLTQAQGSPHQRNLSKIKESEIDQLFEEFYNLHHDFTNEVMDISIIINRHDAGGQPAFLEMLPALTTGPAMYLIFSSLIQELRKQYTVKFKSDKDAKECLCPDYTYTPEEVIFAALSSIEVFGLPDEEYREYIIEEDKDNTQKKDSVTILLGTFDDKAKEAGIDIGLEEYLQEQLPLGNRLVKYNNHDPPQILFHVNNVNGGMDEVKWYQKKFKDIIETCIKRYEIPARWFMLGMCLKYIAIKKRWIVTIDDCMVIGRKLEMDEHEVIPAIKFLHKYIGLVMYFPSVEDDYLSKHVICNPQVIFSSMSEQIFKVYKCNDDVVNDEAYEKLKEKGLLTYSKPEKIKSKTEEYSNEDENSSEDSYLTFNSLMKLLAHLNIVAPVGPSQSLEYFLPAVLKSAPDHDLKLPDDWNKEQKLPEPLIIKFKTFFLPLGLFCGLIAKLYSTNGYNPIEKYKPRKNMVTFRTNNNFDVTLISWPRFCEVRICSVGQPYTSKELSSCCCEVREGICAAINSVIKTMSHSILSKASEKYFLGFKCPHTDHEGERLGHESIAEIALVAPDNVPEEMVCSDEYNRNMCKVHLNLSMQQKMWYAKPTCPCISSQQTPFQKVGEGKEISLTVTAEGSSPLTYQWTRDGEQLKNDIHYTGSSTNCLLIKHAHFKLMGKYCCTVSNKVGKDTSAPTSLTIANLKFSKDFDCEQLAVWLKQNKISGTDLQLLKDQKINGKSFLRLPLNKKTFEDEVRQTVTIGGWDNIVDLIMEARKELSSGAPVDLPQSPCRAKLYTEKEFESLSPDCILKLMDDVTILGEKDLTEVLHFLEKESANWQLICTKLHVATNTIQGLATSNKTHVVRLTEGLTEWLKLNYMFQEHGKPTWRKVAESVITTNTKLFLDIAKKHLMEGVVIQG